MGDQTGVFRHAAVRTGCAVGALFVAVSFIVLFLVKINLTVVKYDLLHTQELVRIR